MKLFRSILAALALVVTTACASVTETPSALNCLKMDNNTSMITASSGVNFEGMSIPVMAGQFVFQGDANCQLVKTADGRPIGYGQQFTQDKDIRTQLATGATNVVAAASNGLFAAQVMSDNKCQGNNCGGGNQFFVQGGVAQALSGSESNSGATAGATVTSGACGPNRPCGISGD